MKPSKNRICISKKKIQTLRQDEVEKLVKTKRITRKQAIRKILLIAPFVWIFFLLFAVSIDHYHYEVLMVEFRLHGTHIFERLKPIFARENPSAHYKWSVYLVTKDM